MSPKSLYEKTMESGELAPFDTTSYREVLEEIDRTLDDYLIEKAKFLQGNPTDAQKRAYLISEWGRLDWLVNMSNPYIHALNEDEGEQGKRVTRMEQLLLKDPDLIPAFQKALDDQENFHKLPLEEQGNIRRIVDLAREQGFEATEQISSLRTETWALYAQFCKNLREAKRDATLHLSDASELEGVSPPILRTLAEAATHAGKKGFLLSPEPELIEQIPSPILRRKITDPWYPLVREVNTELAYQILARKKAVANLIVSGDYPNGHPSWAHVVLARTGETPEALLAQMEGPLGLQILERAQQKWEELQRFLGYTPQDSGTVLYEIQRWKREKNAYSEGEVMEGLRRDAVASEFMQILGEITSVKVTETAAPVWHPSVRFFRMPDAEQANRAIYLDLASRDGKSARGISFYLGIGHKEEGRQRSGGAWVRMNLGENISYDNFVILCHELFHGVQRVFSRADQFPVAQDCDYDIVKPHIEFASNLGEELAGVEEVLQRVSQGRLSPDLIKKVLAARQDEECITLLRGLRMAILDLKLQTEFDPKNGPGQIQAIQQMVDRKWSLGPVHPDDSFCTRVTQFVGTYTGIVSTYVMGKLMAKPAFAHIAQQAGGPLHPNSWRPMIREVMCKPGSGNMRENLEALMGPLHTIRPFE